MLRIQSVIVVELGRRAEVGRHPPVGRRPDANRPGSAKKRPSMAKRFGHSGVGCALEAAVEIAGMEVASAADNSR
jgi:hypothetical protein